MRKSIKKPNKKFLSSIVPDEVIWVWILEGISQPIGSKLYDQVEEIVNKYPEYFPEKKIDTSKYIIGIDPYTE